MMDALLAHAGESHDDVVETTSHFLSIDTTTLTLLVIALGIALPLLAYRLTRSFNITFYLVMAELLVVGLMAYSFSPALSMLAIVVGFCVSLFVVLASVNN